MANKIQYANVPKMNAYFFGVYLKDVNGMFIINAAENVSYRPANALVCCAIVTKDYNVPLQQYF